VDTIGCGGQASVVIVKHLELCLDRQDVIESSAPPRHMLAAGGQTKALKLMHVQPSQLLGAHCAPTVEAVLSVRHLSEWVMQARESGVVIMREKGTGQLVRMYGVLIKHVPGGSLLLWLRQVRFKTGAA
jgi:hypothetical protein